MRTGFGCPSGDERDVRGSLDAGQGVPEHRGSEARGAPRRRRRVKGERDAGTAARLAVRAHRSSGADACTASRRRGRRSGPLTRLAESTLSGRVRRSSRSTRGRALASLQPSRRAPDRRTLPPGEGGGPGAGPRMRNAARRRRAWAHPAAGVMPSAMRRNSARRSACTRRAASRSVSVAAAASSSSKSRPGLRCRSAPGSERNLA